jgi:hypothetical protein
MKITLDTMISMGYIIGMIRIDQTQNQTEEDEMNQNHGTDNNPNHDVTETTVTLPNGKTQVFKTAANGNVYPAGSSQFWTTSQFTAALDKMRAAGATVTEATL